MAGALGLRHHEVMATVGGGGKTGALCRLSGELAAAGSRVIATTTTTMFYRELATVGPVIVVSDLSSLRAAVIESLNANVVVAVARALMSDGKVAGVPTDWVDEIRAAGMADFMIVEADGSRGKSLKAYAAHEPAVPPCTTLILQVAGVEVVGMPLSEERVHRAGFLAQDLQVPLGSILTPELFVRCLVAQIETLGRRWPTARVVTLLNKAETVDRWTLGEETAVRLLASSHGESAGGTLLALRYSEVGPRDGGETL
jgi:probable selenium-dependent hydroxylase accessory protein YqeC